MSFPLAGAREQQEEEEHQEHQEEHHEEQEDDEERRGRVGGESNNPNIKDGGKHFAPGRTSNQKPMTRIGNPESETASELESETTFSRIGNHCKRVGNRLRTRIGNQLLSDPKLLETNRKTRRNLGSETWESWGA